MVDESPCKLIRRYTASMVRGVVMALSDGAALLLLSTSIWGVATWYSSYIIQSVSLTRIFATAGIASMIALLLMVW
jgi:hypothetical protein|tara:strand:+ start:175 stop:402 length:228 start_codon:yes stop_codon:yes gene_type:complete